MSTPTLGEDLELLTAQEAARALRISASFFHKAVACGDLPAPIRIGRRTFWPRDLVRRVITEKLGQ